MMISLMLILWLAVQPGMHPCCGGITLLGRNFILV
jgi:hypothetical protein